MSLLFVLDVESINQCRSLGSASGVEFGQSHLRLIP